MLRYTWADSANPLAVELSYPPDTDFADDFETGDLSGWPTTTGAVSAETAAANQGLYGLRLDPGGGSAAAVATSTVGWDQDHAWGVAWCRLRIDELAASGSMDMITLRNTAGSGHADLFVHSSGTIWLDLVGGSSEVDTEIVAETGHWYTIGLRVHYGDTTHRAWVSIDGVEYGPISQTGATPSYVRSLHLGTTSTSKDYTISVDGVGVIVDDADPGLVTGSDWQDVTQWLSDAGVRITRGLRAEGNTPEPASAELTLANSTGRFTPEHPESPLYGLVGRFTPLRVRVQVDGTWYTRFVGEVASWEQSWDLTGPDAAITTVAAAGVLRRVGLGEDRTRSSLYRGTSGAGPTLLAYWPMEEGTRARSWTADRGGYDGAITGEPEFAVHDTIACSEPLATIEESRSRMEVPQHDDTGEWQVRALVHMPAGTPDEATVLSAVATGGNIVQVDVRYTTGGGLRTVATYADGSTHSWSPVAYDVDDRDLLLSLEVAQDGSDVDLRISVMEPGETATTYLNTDTSQTVGRLRRVLVNPSRAALADLALGHCSAWSEITSIYDLADEVAAWDSERAAHRIYRLATEAGLEVELVGDDATSQRMGRQDRGALLDLIEEAAEIGAGILYEGRDTGTIVYRSLSGLVHQDPDLEITYEDNLLIPCVPASDDRSTANRVTVTRQDGASATVEDSTTPMGTSAPPYGIGVCDESVTLSLGVDGQARDQAGWRVALGTVAGARWPAVGINLAHPTLVASPSLTADVLALDVGDRLDVSSLPAWLPPDGISGLILGYTEEIGPEDFQLTYVLAPYEPYRVGRYYDTGISDRYDQRTTTTTAAATSSATSLSVTSAMPPYWAHDGTDYDLVVAGEVVTLTGVAGAGPAQTLTVTRGVNGVSKAHAAGTRVSLATPVRYGLGS